MDVCNSCSIGRHFLCYSPVDKHCCCGDKLHNRQTDLFGGGPDQGQEKKVGRPRLEADALANPLASGRARAAAEHAIEDGAICDWSGLKKAGGGKRPIIGCAGNTATNLHHGPDKNTLNNERGVNLHAICATCHNRWHGENDRYYGPERPAGKEYLPLPQYECLPHDSETKATEVEIQFNEEMWKERRRRRRKVVYGDEPGLSGSERPGV